MTRNKLTIRWSMAALAMATGALGACSNDNSSTGLDPATDAMIQQLQNELDQASAQGALSSAYRSVKPVLKCVEKVSSSTYKAHWGYKNSSSSSVAIPVGFNNRFWPSPINRGQPTTFLPGSQADVVQVPFSSYSASVWILGASLDIATKYSKACPTGTGTGGAMGTGGAGGRGVSTGGAGGGGVSHTGGAGGGGVSHTGGAGGGGVSHTGGAGGGGVSQTGGAGGGGISSTGGAGGGLAGCPSTCDDQNPCTTDICNAATNFQCSHVALADGSTCSDGNACTAGDTCQAGACTAGTPRTCTASDQCHGVGTCDPTSGACSNPTLPNGTVCDDGSACTSGDSCQLGVCQGGTAKTCAASDQCHAAGTCDPASGACSNPVKTDGSACNDGNACTTGDQCLSGICTMGNPTICQAADQCHAAGVCDMNTGACSNPNAPNGTVCNDSNACTTADICTSGVCGGTAKTCAASDQCHAAGICDQTSGNCTNPPVTDGTACNDGSACTTGDKCVAGACTAGTPKTCAASDQCHAAGTCDPASGTCSNPAVADGTVCSDSNACTTGDTCVAGACTSGAPKTCTASGVCRVAGTCDPTTGACADLPAPNGTPCDDGNMCSTGDSCQAGQCVATMTLPPTHCRGQACEDCQGLNCVLGQSGTDGCDGLASAADRALCEQIYACFVNPANNCLLPGNQGDAIPCWCGTNLPTCVSSNSGTTKANGPCLGLVTLGAGLTDATYDAATIKARLVNPSFPLGRAINLTSCEGQFCNAECNIP